MTYGPLVGVVNYGMGTWTSVVNMFESIGIASKSCVNPAETVNCSHIVLPGVGNFSVASKNLISQGWNEVIERRVQEGSPILGICLGMQLLGHSSDESDGAGLGVFDFRSRLLVSSESQRVPHMGWNTIELQTNHRVFSRWTPEFRFYFSHSFAVPPESPNAIGLTIHGEKFSSVVARDNVVGVQFHPEKSHRFGKQLFENFVEME